MKSKIEIQVHDSRCLQYNNRREKIKVGDFNCHFDGVPPYTDITRIDQVTGVLKGVKDCINL